MKKNIAITLKSRGNKKWQPTKGKRNIVRKAKTQKILIKKD